MPEHKDMNESQKANLRLDHINGDIKEIKESIKESNRLIQSNSGKINETNVGMASLKTEVRIVGALILTMITALLGLALSRLAF